MATITKKDLIDRIAANRGIRRGHVKTSVQDFLDGVIDALAAGDRLEFREFGVFEVRQRSARVAQNPKTLQRLKVPAKLTVRFKVGRKMREKLEKVDISQLNGHVTVKAPKPAVAAV